MERLYGSHNRARPSRIVCQPSDVILWINTPFDTKNFKRKYESLIKHTTFEGGILWLSVFLGGGSKKKANYPISAGLKVAPGKKVAENRCRPFWRVWFFFSKKKQSEEEAQSRNKREESFFGLFWSRVLPPKQSHFLHLHKRSEFSLSLYALDALNYSTFSSLWVALKPFTQRTSGIGIILVKRSLRGRDSEEERLGKEFD